MMRALVEQNAVLRVLRVARDGRLGNLRPSLIEMGFGSLRPERGIGAQVIQLTRSVVGLAVPRLDRVRYQVV
jgi:hypothetical protein